MPFAQQACNKNLLQYGTLPPKWQLSFEAVIAFNMSFISFGLNLRHTGVGRDHFHQALGPIPAPEAQLPPVTCDGGSEHTSKVKFDSCYKHIYLPE